MEPEETLESMSADLKATRQELETLQDGLRQLLTAVPTATAVSKGAIRMLLAGSPPRKIAPAEPVHEPDLGHRWNLTVTSIGSGKVVGEEHHSDSNWESDPWRLSVRAWSLRDALTLAASMPLGAWDTGEEPDDVVHPQE